MFHKLQDSFPVSTGLNQIVGCAGEQGLGFLGGNKSRYVCLADGVFTSKAHLIGGGHFWCHHGHDGMLNGWHDVDFVECGVSLHAVVSVELDIDLAVFAEGHLAVAIPAILAGPHEHISLASRQRGDAFVVGNLGGGRIEFAVIVDAELHSGTLDGFTLLVDHFHSSGCSGGIVADEVDFGEIAGAGHHFLGTIVIAKGTGVHQHCP